jgi:hypothetical protein
MTSILPLSHCYSKRNWLSKRSEYILIRYSILRPANGSLAIVDSLRNNAEIMRLQTEVAEQTVDPEFVKIK